MFAFGRPLSPLYSLIMRLRETLYQRRVFSVTCLIDGQIVATGISYDFTVVTRNITDMEMSGATLLNPWG